MDKTKSATLLLNEIWIIVLCGVITGAFFYEIFKRQLPCPLCLLQRLGMIATAMGPLFNLIFGIRPKHYAFAMAGAIFGGSVSIRQILLHICPGFPTFGLPVFGLELYTWAFIVAVSSLVATLLLLALYKQSEEYVAPSPLRPLGYVAVIYLIAIILANTVVTFMECGVNFCPDNPMKFIY